MTQVHLSSFRNSARSIFSNTVGEINILRLNSIEKKKKKTRKIEIKVENSKKVQAC